MSGENLNENPAAAAAAPLVLVVEDEVLVRMAVAEELRDAGFGVLEAADGDEAVQLFTARADVAIVFSDVNMPGSIDGIELARVVRAARPTVPVLLTSGVIDGLVSGDPRLSFDVLPKPYDSSALVTRLRAMVKARVA